MHAPTCDADLVAWLAVALAAQGRTSPWLAAVRGAGGVTRFCAASDGELRALGLAARARARLAAAGSGPAVRALEKARRLGQRLAVFGGPSYPAALAGIDDPPLVLFWRGAEPTALAPAVAVVGARRCTDYGRRIAAAIAGDLARAGIVVVSGLARGVDAAAHRGALDAGPASTAAVLAGGLDRVYPPEHRGLAERIVDAGGWLLSESPPGERSQPWMFPHRNRIVTAVAAATVIVEAGARSGSSASARHALAQGREVFAVPGPIDSPLSVGTNRLLVEGAPPFLSVEDLAAVPELRVPIERLAAKLSNKIEKFESLEDPEAARLLAAIVAREATADDLAEVSALDGTRVLALLTALEMDGLVARTDSGRFAATATGGRWRATEEPEAGPATR